MLDISYSFCTPLRDAIIKGTYTQTALGNLFGEKVYQNTGIYVLYANSWFDIPHLSVPCIFIYTDIKQSAMHNHEQFHAIQGGYQPHGNMKDSILSCFQQATHELELPPVSFADSPKDASVFIHDFATTAGSIYFSVNIKSLDQLAKLAFPHLDFSLRFRMCSDVTAPQHYYLIFADKQTQNQTQLNGDTTRIIDWVENYCQSHDPLRLFDTQPIRPHITNKKQLKEQGLVMGIMRDNPNFEEW